MSTKYTMTIGTFMRDVSSPHNATGYTGNTPKSGIEKDKLSLLRFLYNRLALNICYLVDIAHRLRPPQKNQRPILKS